ncbi:hypothetical protein HX99_05670 [Peptococcaceae bacterium SCADC1_2_3]|jgi:prevent-host-death family protein|nr:hypothetical protein DK28_0211805 [Peptococcaceae bacterium SCADC1_2_3]KFI35591.1 hypothetical protein HX99_05670 [Peptococcaceae bacterium SCADC1_2_3]KFI37187.1 hypothetical protein HY02_09780 [Peptococcaceae bacterium SCADC1_2_3]
MLIMNVSQAKRSFLELIRRTEDQERVVIEKKGKPVAAILPYGEYINLNRVRSYLAMQEISQAMKDFGLTAEEVYRESRQELERSR